MQLVDHPWRAPCAPGALRSFNRRRDPSRPSHRLMAHGKGGRSVGERVPSLPALEVVREAWLPSQLASEASVPTSQRGGSLSRAGRVPNGAGPEKVQAHTPKHSLLRAPWAQVPGSYRITRTLPRRAPEPAAAAVCKYRALLLLLMSMSVGDSPNTGHPRQLEVSRFGVGEEGRGASQLLIRRRGPGGGTYGGEGEGTGWDGISRRYVDVLWGT